MDTNNFYIKIKEYIISIPRKMWFLIIAIILLIGFCIGGYFLWHSWKKPEVKKVLENISGNAEQITNSATQGVLPSLQTNPLENQPDINPANNANPIKNIKTNPF